MNNIKVTKIEFLGYLIPRSECRYSPFCSTPDVCAEDLPSEINQKIWEEFKKGRDVIPVKMTLKVTLSKDITNDVADKVLVVARRALKSVEYINESDRGAINSGWLTGNNPYVFSIKVSPLSVIEALTSGCPYNVRVIGFLTRAN